MKYLPLTLIVTHYLTRNSAGILVSNRDDDFNPCLSYAERARNRF